MFNPLQLIRSPWAEAFSDFVRSIRSGGYRSRTFHWRWGRWNTYPQCLILTQPPKIDLITNLAVNSLLNGTVDTEAIAGFSRKLSSVTVSEPDRAFMRKSILLMKIWLSLPPAT